MNEIKIRGLEVYARHGVRAEEKTEKQKFVIDADLRLDFYEAYREDDLNLTVSYSDVCDRLVELTKSNCFNLIETLAYTLAYDVLDEFKLVSGISLTVHKPQAPIKHRYGDVSVTVSAERVRTFLSLGSSLGDKKKYLDGAIEALKNTAGTEVKKVSSYIETEPYGGVAENTFLNCAVEIETYLTPHALLGEIHKIEAAFGRKRDVHWGDRTLDIDIVFFGNRVIFDDCLIIPHPEYSKRDFVLTPLKEIAPEFLTPDEHKKLKNY